MSQRNIDFGSFPDDPDADAIRIAFQKTQENFTELFSGLGANGLGNGVLSINRIPGNGITVSSPTGNVIISANFAALTVQSSSLNLGTSPGQTSPSATISNTAQVLYVDMPSNLSNITNLVVSNAIIANFVIANSNITANNAAITSNLTAGNVTGANLVSANYITGTLTTNAQPNITSVGTLTSLTVAGNITVGNINGGNLVKANYLEGTLTTLANNQPNITDVGTLNSLNVTGNLTSGNANLGNLAKANYFQGDGSLLTNVVGVTGNVLENGNSNVIVQPNSNVVISVAGVSDVLTVANNGIYVLGSSTLTGNLTALNANITNNLNVVATSNLGNLATANYVNVSQNITAVGSVTAGNVTGNFSVSSIYGNFTANVNAGNVLGGNLVSANYLQGTLTTNAQPNVTSLGNLILLNVTGNVTAPNFVGNLANGTSSISIPAASGNINFNVNNIPNVVVVTTTGLSVANTINTGNLNVTNTSNLGNLATANYITVSENITANGNIAGNNSTFTNNLQSNNATITSNLSSGNANLGNLASANYIQGTLTTNAQPNITSVGTLTSLDVSGNITAGNVITGGLANGLSNVAIPTANGNVNISVNGTANVVQVSNTTMTVTSNLTVTNTANVANIDISNTMHTENARANVFVLGTGVWQFTTSNVFGAQTFTNTPNQEIYAVNANTVSALDFVIVTTDTNANQRQISKISAIVYGPSGIVNNNEVSYIATGPYLGDMSIAYDNITHSPPAVRLNFSPATSNTMTHRILITAYAA
jgi:hypothetical protein